MKTLTSLALIVLGVCAAGCGGTSKGTRSASPVASTVGASSADAPATTANATSALRGLKGDEDDDDTASEVNGPKGTLDSDDDYDNDYEDNAIKGYYDSDDSVAESYGHTANVADERTVTALVRRYFAAAAAGDGARACSLVTSTFVRAIPEDYGQAPGPAYARGKTCPVVASKVFRHLRGKLAGSIKVTDVRVNGNEAHALLGSKTMPASYIALRRERGAWKIADMLGYALP
jgi:hypothetical protein